MTIGAPRSTRLRFAVNGQPIEFEGPGGRRLLDVLRRDLGLTGTKEGCGEGECGACSVLVDGRLVDSCLVPVCQVRGQEVTTVEGLAPRGPAGGDAVAALAGLDPLQRTFVVEGAAQCGICTPGMLMAARAFVDSGAAPTDEAIRAAIAGNLCRCTGYTKIVEAIALAADAGNGSRLAAARDAQAASGSAPAQAPPTARVVTASGGGEVVEPAASLADALRRIAEGWRPIAGGTDVMVLLAAGALPPGERWVDIGGLPDLRGIARSGPHLVVGAATTYAELIRSPEVAAALPALAEVAASIGAVQIRERGTIGGNIVNASPAGDTLPLLLATDADLVLRSERAERILPAAAFFTGYRRIARAADELLAEVRFPLEAGRVVRYRKVGTRRAQAISKVVMAVSWRRDPGPDGALRSVRVALGSVAERPIRAPGAEAVLEGGIPSVDLADRAAAAVGRDVRPIDDVRSTAAYRRAVSGRVLRRIVLEAI